jgi:hypothetical protein
MRQCRIISPNMTLRPSVGTYSNGFHHLITYVHTLFGTSGTQVQENEGRSLAG